MALLTLATAFGAKVYTTHTPDQKALHWGKPAERMEMLLNTAHPDHLTATRDLLEMFLERPGQFWNLAGECGKPLEGVHTPEGYGAMLVAMVVRLN